MRKRVLVFDDDRGVRALLWDVLDDRGYEVHTFPHPGLCPLYTSEDCKCALDERCSDVIISDLSMPNVRGLEFVKSLLGKGCRCEHIALMSGMWSPEETELAHSLGCKLFTKPFPINRLKQWLDEIERTLDPQRRLAKWFLA